MRKFLYFLLAFLIAFPVLVYAATRRIEFSLCVALGELIASILFWILICRGIFSPIRATIRWNAELERGNLDEPADVPMHSAGPIAELVASKRRLIVSRRAFNETLFRAQEGTRAAINSLPHAVAIITDEGKIEMVNEAAQRLFGFRPGVDVAGLPQPWLEAIVSRALQTGQVVEPSPGEPAVQVFDPPPSGRERFFLPRAVPMLDSARKIVGVMVLLIDATQLRQIDEAKSGLLANLSHELKTPLTSIQMSLHLLIDDAPPSLSRQQYDLLKTACEDADRLHLLIQNILDAGRRGRGMPESGSK